MVFYIPGGDHPSQNQLGTNIFEEYHFFSPPSWRGWDVSQAIRGAFSSNFCGDIRGIDVNFWTKGCSKIHVQNECWNYVWKNPLVSNLIFKKIWRMQHLGVSKNRGGPPKWMVYNGKPYLLMDDLGVPLFLVQHHLYRPARTWTYIW